MNCAILGDSIAVGLHSAMPDCSMKAKSGITSRQYVLHYVDSIAADMVIISLTANDLNIDSLKYLRELRQSISGKVIWLMPNIQRAAQRNAVETVARENGDQLIDTKPYVGSDHIHLTPATARTLAKRLGY